MNRNDFGDPLIPMILVRTNPEYLLIRKYENFSIMYMCLHCPTTSYLHTVSVTQPLSSPQTSNYFFLTLLPALSSCCSHVFNIHWTIASYSYLSSLCIWFLNRLLPISCLSFNPPLAISLSLLPCSLIAESDNRLSIKSSEKGQLTPLQPAVMYSHWMTQE